MYTDLAELINGGKWDLAEIEFQKYKNTEWTDTLSILAASIYWHKEDYNNFLESVTKGLTYNFRNYELYLLLGNYYEQFSPEQAWLCYENAEFYCYQPEDAKIISEFKNNISPALSTPIRKTAIVILSYNSLEITKACIQSIRDNNLPSSYELILVDNNSEDGSREWLQQQKDIKLICNDQNMGFPYGCNQGIKIADPESDIFLLNSDTVVAPNSIFWLRMGLYSGARIGATGSVSNRVYNHQQVENCGTSIEECMEYAVTHNVPMKNPYEKKLYLIGFAMMIKREALDDIGLLDVRFSPGTYEDNDYGVRLHKADWEVLLCKNSFIYHRPGNHSNATTWHEIANTNAKKFFDKWNINIGYYSSIKNELIQFIKEDYNQPINVLEIGCGFGATLAHIESLWSNAKVYGIESEENVTAIASHYLNIIQGNAETMHLPYPTSYFDYIILGDVLESLINPENLLKRLTPYLRAAGQFICSMPNLMHTSALFPLLLNGTFDYQSTGILGKTHLKFFTLDSIYKLFNRCGLEISDIKGITSITEENNQILDTLLATLPMPDKQQFLISQYLFCASAYQGNL